MYFKKQHKLAGMTLVETIVVVSIFAVLSLAIGEAISSFYRYNSYTIAQAYQVAQARRGLDSMVQDLREMTYADDGSFPLVLRSSSTVTFYSDIDKDSSVEKVSYNLAGQTLFKYIYEATGTPAVYGASPTETFRISEYVHNDLESVTLFTYYDSDGVAVGGSNVSNVRSIDVELVVNVDPVREPGKYRLAAGASLRNLKEYDN